MKRGANLTGGATSYTTWGSTGIPVPGQHYLFVTTADVDYLISKGFDTFRLLFSWEAVQKTPLAALGTGTYWNTFKALADYITGKGCTCILDIHGDIDADDACYYGVSVGGTYQGHLVTDLLVDLWSQMASFFPACQIGISNEPHTMDPTTWFKVAQTIITALRAKGHSNRIVCPGATWDNASTWVSGGNASADTLSDPIGNTAIQVHMYLDANAGGGANDIVDANIGVTRLTPVVTWARAHGVKVVLGEVGFAASNPLAQQAWDNLFAFMTANSDVIEAWCWWAYGPPKWWGGYRFTLCPNADGTDCPQMTMISKGFDPTVPLKAKIADLTKQLSDTQALYAAALTKIANVKEIVA